jgi:hypothetical protein
VAAGALTAAGLAAALLLVAVERLPVLLVATATWLFPGHRLELGDARLVRPGRLVLRHVRWVERATGAVRFAAKRVRVDAAPRALLGRTVGAVHLEGPLLVVPAGAAAGGGPPPAWTLGRLVVRRGRLRVAPDAGRPGVAFRFAADLRGLGLAGEDARRAHRVRARDVRVTLADGSPIVRMADALVTVRPAALLGERAVEEVRLFGLVARLPPAAAPPAAGGAATGPARDWRVGRLVVRGARVEAPPAGERPGVALTAAADLRDLGLGAPAGERLHEVRLRDVRVTLGARPPTLVVHEARVVFAPADLVGERRLARLAVDGGTLLVDAALRARLAAAAGGGPVAAGPAGSVGVLAVRGLALRIAELAPGVPDLTLTFETTLREVPLGAEALALARDRQRVELANVRLYSPLDPFREVVRIASVFVDFTLADVVRQRIEALTALSPTIYVGEDLVWYMNAARRQAAPAGGGVPPWTVGRARAELGKIVVTFNGVDRLDLPITFRTEARDVALENVAALRLTAALDVPRQSYAFPELGLELRDMEGKLHFHYPPGRARDNVVNVLEVAEMRWRDYRLTRGWLAVTFDEGGINGKLGGEAYAGYVDGGLSVPFRPGAAWAGWLAATRLDLAPLAQVAAGSGVEARGVADVRGAAVLRAGPALAHAEGDLRLEGPGEIRLPALETLLARLPEDARLRREVARVVVEALRDHPYTEGRGRLRFAGARGEATLTLDGARGRRRVAVRWVGAPGPVAEARP